MEVLNNEFYSQGIPLANINLGALMLTGVVVVGGAMISGISRLVNGGSFIEVAGGIPWFRNKKQKSIHKLISETQFTDLFLSCLR